MTFHFFNFYDCIILLTFNQLLKIKITFQIIVNQIKSHISSLKSLNRLESTFE